MLDPLRISFLRALRFLRVLLKGQRKTLDRSSDPAKPSHRHEGFCGFPAHRAEDTRLRPGLRGRKTPDPESLKPHSPAVWGLGFWGLGFWGLGFWGLGFWGLGFWGLGFRGLGFRVLGFRVLGFRVLGFWVLGFRVLGFRV